MAIQLGTYPTPRRNRAGPATLGPAPAPGALPAPPQSRVVEFRIAVGAGQRSTRSYGPYVGPALVRHCMISVQPGGTNFGEACDVGYAASPVTESLVSSALTRSWTSFFERGVVVGTDLAANIIGKFLNGDITQAVEWQHDIGGIVLLPTWHLVVSVMSAGLATEAAGYINVLAGVSPQALANFL